MVPRGERRPGLAAACATIVVVGVLGWHVLATYTVQRQVPMQESVVPGVETTGSTWFSTTMGVRCPALLGGGEAVYVDADGDPILFGSGWPVGSREDLCADERADRWLVAVVIAVVGAFAIVVTSKAATRRAALLSDDPAPTTNGADPSSDAAASTSPSSGDDVASRAAPSRYGSGGTTAP